MTTRRSTFGSNENMTLSFPPFTRVVKWIIGINVVIYFAYRLAALAGAESVPRFVERFLLLTPSAFVHGWVWQALTYSFVNLGLLQLIFGMLIVWMLGAQLEATYGQRWFIRYYAISALGGAAASIGLAYSGLVPNAPNMAIGGVESIYYGLLVAFGVLFAEQEFFLFPLPIWMKAKYLVGLTLVVAILISVMGPAGLLSLGQLGGLVAGFVYLKFFHRARAYASVPYAGRGLSDRSYAPKKQQREGLFARVKNSYYRWKRKRAARKFEVYMRKHDRNVQFDEYGNYIPPADEQPKKGNGGSDHSGWVN
jgi:membrane associated rhomboid family serine protease